MQDAKKMALGDFVEFSPKVQLERGCTYPFVPMDAVEPGRRFVYVGFREYAGGGAKFAAADTLFARITPCLENGKIAQFQAPPGTPGFGSTEFFVMRGRHGISDSDFVYYLACTDVVRKPAEKSMSGASGRQRADWNSIKDIQVPAPSLPTQRKIAAILSAYDDLIENNTRRIAILEEMARMLYREWFVEYRFPGHEQCRMVDSLQGKIPEGWQVLKLGEAIELAYGKALKAEERREGPVPVYGSSGIVGYHDTSLVNGPGIIVGRKGNVGKVYWSDEAFYPIDTVYFVRSDLPLPSLYFNLQGQKFINNDAAVPGLNRNQAYSLPLLVPTSEALAAFGEIITPVFAQLRALGRANANLHRTRDLLLSRLVSGEVSVEELDIPTEGITA